MDDAQNRKLIFLGKKNLHFAHRHRHRNPTFTIQYDILDQFYKYVSYFIGPISNFQRLQDLSRKNRKADFYLSALTFILIPRQLDNSIEE